MSNLVSLLQWCKDNNREELIREWDYTANASLTPSSVSYGTSVKVWWVCCRGHRWQTRVSHRTLSKSGCPFCAGEKAIPGENDLETVCPAISKEWNYKKNGGLTPEEFLPKSEKKVWWICEKGHEWEAPIFARYHGVNCPYCSNRKALAGYNDLATLYPEILKEWDYSKNVNPPSAFLAISAKKVWWVDSLGHSWEAPITTRIKGGGCPFCAGKRVLKGFNDLKTRCPDLCLEWNYQRNQGITPEMVTAGSEKKVWWICEKGHEWQSRIANRYHGRGCPVCSKNRIKRGINDFATLHPELLEEWDYEKNKDIDPQTIASTGSTKYWWTCRYGHSWQASLNSRISGSGCSKCSIRQRTSFPEQAVFFYLLQTYPDAQSGYTDLFDSWKGSELDIYIPSEAIGIEYDGKVWHKTHMSQEKEKKKYELCKEHNIKLIRIKEEKNEFDVNVCDFVLYVDYSADYKNLNSVIPQLNKYLNVPNDIDVVRDREKIKELYYGIIRKHSLSIEAPSLAKEWNYSKNGKLTPDMYMVGSTDKVWWICSRGHEWQATIYSRFQGIGCPYCSNKKVLKGFNDLSTTNPELVLEWDYQLNPMSPEEITYGYHHRVWWKCSNGHNWLAPPYSRAKGTGCPYCAKKKTLTGYNDLLTMSPNLCEEWDYEKNAPLQPNMVASQSNKKVWWICKYGHSWQATVSHRTAGTGCPFCSGRKVLSGFNDLESKYPLLACEWNYSKNGDLFPSMVTTKSEKKVWWKCKNGHEWQTSINNRTGINGTNCPYCSGKRILPGFNDLATVVPELIEIWDFSKNTDISPEEVGISSHKKVWWKCKNGHEWQTMIISRVQSGTICPFCNKYKMK